MEYNSEGQDVFLYCYSREFPSQKETFFTADKLLQADGNCLMHSISLFLWGIHDSNPVFLRKLMHSALTQDSRNEYKNRWKWRLKNQISTDTSLSFSSDWESVTSEASHVRKEGQPFPYLEDIHIFVVCQIIRRPIIILSEPIIRSLQGHSIAPNTLHGLYLPIMWDPKRCCKSPVVLGFLNSHFVPLLPSEDAKNSENRHVAVPLVVGRNMERLPVRMLLEQEEASASKLLLEYLEVIDIRYEGRKGAVNSFQAAKLTPKTFKEINIMEEFIKSTDKSCVEEAKSSGAKELVDKEKDQRPKCNIDPYPQPSASVHENVAGLEDSLFENIAAFEDPLENHSYNISRMKCITPGCQFYGRNTWFDRCSNCYKKHLATTSAERSRLRREGRGLTSPGFRHSAPLPTGEKEISSTTFSLEEPACLISGLSIADTSCRVKGCPNLASVNTFPYCHEHKALRLAVHGWDVTREPARRCCKSGCDRQGEARFLGLCSACHSSDLQKPTGFTALRNNFQNCKKPGCHGIAIKTERGQCLRCDLDQGYMTDIRAHILHAAYPYTVEFQQEWYNAKCVFPQCEREGFEVLNGLCETCYRQLCRANANVPVREPLDDVTQGQSVSEEAFGATFTGLSKHHVPVSTKLCKWKPGCYHFGDPELSGFCSEHFKQNNKRSFEWPNSWKSFPAPTASRHSTTHSSLESLDIQEQKVWREGAQRTSAAGRPTGQSAKRISRKSVPNRGADLDEQFHQAVTQIETNSRTAVQKCKRANCPNYGNSKCQGYCNSCYPGATYS